MKQANLHLILTDYIKICVLLFEKKTESVKSCVLHAFFKKAKLFSTQPQCCLTF